MISNFEKRPLWSILESKKKRVIVKLNLFIRCYEELNDFLCKEKRKKEFEVSVDNGMNVEELIETLGVPHTAVDLILINGESAPFSHALQNKDRVAIYPEFEAFDISSLTRLESRPLRNPKFILDVGLGILAKYLSACGFDTLYNRNFNARKIVNCSLLEKRFL